MIDESSSAWPPRSFRCPIDLSRQNYGCFSPEREPGNPDDLKGLRDWVDTKRARDTAFPKNTCLRNRIFPWQVG
jgi:hypothetical protein